VNENQVLIGSIARNSMIEIRTSIIEAAGGPQLDLRQYFTSGDGPRPTTRGIRLAMRDAQKLIEHIKLAIERAQGGKHDG
jgi:hypothetical protein